MNHAFNVPLRCPHCGGNQFIHPDNPQLKSQTTCLGCGAISTVGELSKPGVVKEAKRLASEALRATFGKMLK